MRNKKRSNTLTIDDALDNAFKSKKIDLDLYQMEKDLIKSTELSGLTGTEEQLYVVLDLLKDFAINTFKKVAMEEIFKNNFNLTDDDLDIADKTTAADNKTPKWDA